MSKYYKKLIGVGGSVFSISPVQEKAFRDAPGHEMDDWNGRRAKMRSEYSSSALALNMFGIADANLFPGSFWDEVFRLRGYFDARKVECRFEKPLRIPHVVGYSPNLDFFLDAEDRVVGVESKFKEMYSRKRNQKIQQQYFAKFKYWKEWPGLQRLSKRLARYDRLDAAQLIKHALALISYSKDKGELGKFRLVYIYHDIQDKKVEKEHAKQLCDFHRDSGLGRHFIALKYSDYYRRLVEKATAMPDGYVEFLQDRYPSITRR